MTHRLQQRGGFSLVLVVLILSVYLPGHVGGVPKTHDGEANMAKMAQYYLALRQGQVPPRWAPNLNEGFGYPVINFHYPLPFIAGTMLMALQLPTVTSFIIVTLGSLVLGGLGMYRLLLNRFNARSSFLGALFYALSNYALLLVFVRGGIGESTAYGLFPWVLDEYYRLTEKKVAPRLGGQLAVTGMVTGAFLLTHNVTVLFGVPVILGLCLYRCGKEIRKWLYSGVALVIGLSLSAFFWLPALGEQDYTIIGSSPLSSFFAAHFPSLGQLGYDAWGYGYSRPGPVDGLSFSLHPLWLAILGSVLILIARKRSAAWLYWLVIGIGLWLLLILPISLPLWQMMPLLQMSQFPWRLLFFWPVLMAPIIAFAHDKTNRHWWLWLVVVGSFLYGVLNKNQAVAQVNQPDEYWLNYGSTTNVLDENMPRWFNKTTAYQLKENLFKGGVVATDPVGHSPPVVVHWDGSKRRYSITVDEPVTVIEATAYYPGWQVTVDGQKVPIAYEEVAYPGLITYQLDSGIHVIETRFGQRTIYRYAGNLLTVGALSYLVFLIIASRSYKQRERG